MSRADKASTAPTRPTLLDFLVIVAGFALSLFLFQAESLKVTVTPAAPAAAARIVPLLPQLVRLPDGVILLWPIFFVTQRILGRKQGLTSGEWLWVFAWLGTALLTGLGAWQMWGTVPEFLHAFLPWVFLIAYVIVVPSMAAIALVLIVLGWIGRWQQPWTHTFGLVLVIWPALPVGGILTLAKVT
jgi:hypothetical protein